jgi:hypothetical protein
MKRQWRTVCGLVFRDNVATAYVVFGSHKSHLELVMVCPYTQSGRAPLRNPLEIAKGSSVSQEVLGHVVLQGFSIPHPSYATRSRRYTAYATSPAEHRNKRSGQGAGCRANSP